MQLDKLEIIKHLKANLLCQVFAGILENGEYEDYIYDSTNNSICIYNGNKIYFGGQNYDILNMAVLKLLDKFSVCRFSFIDPETHRYIKEKYRLVQSELFDAYYLRDSNIIVDESISRVKYEDIPVICSHSIYVDDTIKERVEGNITKRFSAGIYVENKLISWALIHANNTIGPVYTIQDYRNRGYGKKVVCAVSNRLLLQNYYPIVTISNDNIEAKHLFSSLNFTRYCSYYWLSIIKSDKEILL